MRPVSARFLAAVAEGGSYTTTSRVRVVATGQNGVDPSGAVILTLDGVTGKVVMDATADTRSTMDLAVPGKYWPTDATSALAPYGVGEVFIEKGVVYGDGGTEWVALGYFRIDTPAQQDLLGTVELAGPDRMQGIIDGKIPFPMVFPAGMHITAVIEALVGDIYPWAGYDFDPAIVGAVLATQQVTTDDRYGFLKNLVTAYGCIAYWDYRGLLVVKPPPDPTDPVITIAGGHGGVLSTLSRSLTRQGVTNGVVVSGEQLTDSTQPVTVLVTDDDPNSPTRWGGPFGKVPQFFSSSALTTPGQCMAAGQSILARSTGLPYSLDFGQVPNPALEVDDPALIAYPGHREGHVISQLAVPLEAKTLQTGQTRQLVTGVFG